MVILPPTRGCPQERGTALNESHRASREHAARGGGVVRTATAALLIGCAIALFPTLAGAQTPPPLYSASPQNYTSNSHIVSTTFFNWFTSNTGQTVGPWLPLEGRSAWTGNTPFWRDQIKQVMSAN